MQDRLHHFLIFLAAIAKVPILLIAPVRSLLKHFQVVNKVQKVALWADETVDADHELAFIFEVAAASPDGVSRNEDSADLAAAVGWGLGSS